MTVPVVGDVAEGHLKLPEGFVNFAITNTIKKPINAQTIATCNGFHSSGSPNGVIMAPLAGQVNCLVLTRTPAGIAWVPGQSDIHSN